MKYTFCIFIYMKYTFCRTEVFGFLSILLTCIGAGHITKTVGLNHRLQGENLYIIYNMEQLLHMNTNVIITDC